MIGIWDRRSWWLTLFGLVALTASARAEPDGAERLRGDVEDLCAPVFEGRGTGTEGLAKAADHLEARFREVGLRPYSETGYRQSFSGPGDATLVNLIGVLGGRGSDRHVILGAHYDHLGSGDPGDANHGLLHPGADDNASGVAVLLECARRLSEENLSHDVVVIAFSGEEKGLLGSAHYVEHPSLPLEECTAMVNLDTVGRLFDRPLIVFGTGTAQELPRILQGVNYGFGFTLDLPEKDPGAGDHTSFTARAVPAVQVFSGPHPDYHRPGDTADKLDYEGLDRIAGFTAELLRYLAGRDDPLTFLPPGAEKAAAPGPGRGGGRRVSFGSIPDFNHPGPGILLSGVIPGSPAEEAGLREGDLLVQFAGVAIEDLRGFSDILKGLSAGDEAEAVFERDGEQHRVTVVVTERK